MDDGGNTYVGDSRNHFVHKISPDGTITTIAGSGRRGFSGDGGSAAEAPLDSPGALALDASGALLIADSANFRVRKLSAGAISTIAGNGLFRATGDGGPATHAALYSPRGLAVAPDGSLYVSDSLNHRIRRIAPEGTISTRFGTGLRGFDGDGGPAEAATFDRPYAITFGRAGELYVADRNNHRIRKIESDLITTIAGNGRMGFAGDFGLAIDADIAYPTDLALGPDGTIYIATHSGVTPLRSVDVAGTITSVLGTPVLPPPPAFIPNFIAEERYQPFGVTTDTAGNVYYAERLRHRVYKRTPQGEIVIVAGTGTNGLAGDGGLALEAQLSWPTGVALDRAGNLYIVDRGNRRIRKVDPFGVIATVAGDHDVEFGDPHGIAVDAAGDLYVSDAFHNRIYKITFERERIIEPRPRPVRLQ